jgi:hypothetical protein
MYGAADYEDAVVLDVGADEGSTADFFFAMGARKVVVSEKDPELAERLEAKADADHRVVPVGEMVNHKSFQEWITTYLPHIVKVDIEGGEEYLLRVASDTLSRPEAWLIETHSKRIHALLTALFTALGYRVTVADEWDFNEEVKVLFAEAQAFPVRTFTVADYVRMIETCEPFAQANYGDGEWGCLLGHRGGNVNGEPYDPVIRDALRRTLLEHVPGYLCGTNPGWKLQREVEAWIATHGLGASERWVHKETLANASVHGEFAPVLAALRLRKVLVVGPACLRELPVEHFGATALVEVPGDGSAWKVVGETCDAVRSLAAGEPDSLVLFASGMASNMMIYRLWGDEEFRATGASLLDVGATLDPYVGRRTRSSHRRPEFDEAMRRNLEV